jgi:hypothetical protein
VIAIVGITASVVFMINLSSKHEVITLLKNREDQLLLLEQFHHKSGQNIQKLMIQTIKRN